MHAIKKAKKQKGKNLTHVELQKDDPIEPENSTVFTRGQRGRERKEWEKVD